MNKEIDKEKEFVIIKEKITESWERIREGDRQIVKTVGSDYMTDKAKKKFDAIWELYKCIDFARNLNEFMQDIENSGADEETKKWMKIYLQNRLGINIADV